MFNIEKILLFVVTMITSAAFLIFIPLIHIQIDWAFLVTHHRIKVALTLLSPIIFGAITAYIAYQQYCLAKTQANISRDQRDIAHDSLRMGNSEKLFFIYNNFSQLHVKIFKFSHSYPIEFIGDLKYIKIQSVIHLKNLNISGDINNWSELYISESREIEILLETCWVNSKQCQFMFDKKTSQAVFYYFNEAYNLFKLKKDCLEFTLKSYEDEEYIHLIEKHSYYLDMAFQNMSVLMNPYMDISAILEPR